MSSKNISRLIWFGLGTFLGGTVLGFFGNIFGRKG